MVDLFVIDTVSEKQCPACVAPATENDLKSTKNWQTDWTYPAAINMPNKVALHLTENNELLGLMSYELSERGMAVEVIYAESAPHSNAHLLHATGRQKRYLGIAKALFAYAIDISMQAGYDGVLVFKAKTSELLEYYMRVFGAQQVGSYDPFRLVIWEDAAEEILSEFRRDIDV